jgi:hypothetical protein
MKAVRVAVLAFFGFSRICLGHVDARILLHGDGRLEGLPAEFGPASMKVEFAKRGSDVNAIESVTLTLGSSTVRLPPCLVGHVYTTKLDDIVVSASWYHMETRVPHYLMVRFLDPGHQGPKLERSGYSFLFDLRSAKVMRMEVVIVREGGKSRQAVPVDMNALCGAEELEGVTAELWREKARPKESE